MLGLPKKNRNKKGLALTPEPTISTSSASSQSSQSSPQAFPSSANSSSSLSNVLVNSTDSKTSYHTTLEQQLATLELARTDAGRQGEKMELREGDLEVVQELGSGNGGVVSHCRHKRTGIEMAKKVVHIATSPATRKQILRELQILHDCNSPYIVSFYGAYLAEPSIAMCMEFMDKGSLDTIYKKVGPIAEPILAQIAFAIVSGLTYLYEVHKIMHRDVKPSNVLLNSAGEIKICDFGVSGELINSVADTFVGTSTYMSPERISGDPYTVKSDVWSLGITIVELAIGRFPFSSSALDDEEDDGLSSDAEGSANEFKGNDEILFGGNDIDGSSRGERSMRIGSGSGSNGFNLGGEEGEDTLSPVKPHKKSESVEAAEKRRIEKRASRIASSPLISSTIVDPASSSTITSLPPQSAVPPKKKSTKATGVSLSGGSNQMSILELLQYIVNEPSPTLPTALRHPTTGDKVVFSKEMRVFVESCLRKEPVAFQSGGRRKNNEVKVEVVGKRRPVPRELLSYVWMKDSKTANTDVQAFAKSIS